MHLEKYIVLSLRCSKFLRIPFSFLFTSTHLFPLCLRARKLNGIFQWKNYVYYNVYSVWLNLLNYSFSELTFQVSSDHNLAATQISSLSLQLILFCFKQFFTRLLWPFYGTHLNSPFLINENRIKHITCLHS